MREGSIETMHSVVKIWRAWRSTSSRCWRFGSSSSGVTPASTSVRQPIRSETPSAASSGPCPLTSPTTAWIVPDGTCTASKKSPPSRERRRPGR